MLRRRICPPPPHPHPHPYMLTVGCSRLYVCGARRALLAICIHLTLSDLTYLNFLFYSHRAPTCTKNTCTALQGVQKQSNHHVPSDRLYISAAVLYVPVCARCVRCMFTPALKKSLYVLYSVLKRKKYIYIFLFLYFITLSSYLLSYIAQSRTTTDL